MINRNNGDYGIGGAIPFVASPFNRVAQDGSRMAILESGFRSGAEGEARLVIRGALGDTLLSRAYPFTGKSIPRSEIDSAIQSQVRGHLSNPSSAPGFRQMVADLEKELTSRAPAYRSPFRTVQLGLDDTIWLRLSWGVSGDGYYLMLDGKGEPIATIKLPPRTVMMAANREHMWTVQAGVDDLSSIVRYRIQGSQRSSSAYY